MADESKKPRFGSWSNLLLSAQLDNAQEPKLFAEDRFEVKSPYVPLDSLQWAPAREEWRAKADELKLGIVSLHDLLADAIESGLLRIDPRFRCGELQITNKGVDPDKQCQVYEISLVLSRQRSEEVV